MGTIIPKILTINHIRRVKSYILKHKSEILLFCLAFSLRFLYVLIIYSFYGQSSFTAFTDASGYLNASKNLISYGVFSQTEGLPLIPDSARTPLYPLFISFFILFKTPLLGIVIAQNVLAGLMAVLTYKIAKKLFYPSFVGIIAAIFFAVEPVSIYWSGLLMSDYLFGFIFLCAVYLFINRHYYLFSVVLGLVTLTKPIGLYFFPVFLLMLIIKHFFVDKGKNLTQSIFLFIRKILLMSLVFLIVISPWMVRNKIVFNTWGISSAGWYNLYFMAMGKFAVTNDLPFPIPTITKEYSASRINHELFYYDFKHIPFYKKHFFETLSGHYYEFFKFYFIKTIKGFNNHGYDYLIDSVIMVKLPSLINDQINQIIKISLQIIWILIYILMFIGFFIRKNIRSTLFLSMIVFSHTILVGYMGFKQAGRLYLPVLPLIFLLAGNGIIACSSYLSSIKTKLCQK